MNFGVVCRQILQQGTSDCTSNSVLTEYVKLWLQKNGIGLNHYCILCQTLFVILLKICWFCSVVSGVHTCLQWLLVFSG